MFNSNRSTEVVGRHDGGVLTVVDSAMRGRLDVVLLGVARPVHLDSLSAAIAFARNVAVRAVLLGPGAVSPEASANVASLASVCIGGILIAVIGGWSPAMPERLLAFGGCGVRDAVDLSRPEGLKRLRTLLTRGEWDLANRVAETLRPSLEWATNEMRFFVSHLIRTAPFVSSMKAFAEELQVPHSSINSRFFRARLPSPKMYLATTRLLYAAGVLETPGVSVSQAARRLHYSSPQSFGRHVREQLGVSASEFREQYPFKVMASRFTNHFVLRHKDTLRWFEPLGRSVSATESRCHNGE